MRLLSVFSEHSSEACRFDTWDAKPASSSALAVCLCAELLAVCEFGYASKKPAGHDTFKL